MLLQGTLPIHGERSRVCCRTAGDSSCITSPRRLTALLTLTAINLVAPILFLQPGYLALWAHDWRGDSRGWRLGICVPGPEPNPPTVNIRIQKLQASIRLGVRVLLRLDAAAGRLGLRSWFYTSACNFSVFKEKFNRPSADPAPGCGCWGEATMVRSRTYEKMTIFLQVRRRPTATRQVWCLAELANQQKWWKQSDNYIVDNIAWKRKQLGPLLVAFSSDNWRRHYSCRNCKARVCT